MKRLLGILFSGICFYACDSTAMAERTVHRIEARLRRYRRKPTNLIETRTFEAETRALALAALKQYAKEHSYKNYRILWEHQVIVD
jgi:hypothetical protein